jgi:hypothetical protein
MLLLGEMIIKLRKMERVREKEIEVHYCMPHWGREETGSFFCCD